MTVQVRPARTAADFAAVHRMQAEMAAWDAQECAALGCPADAAANAFYGGDAGALRTLFTGHGAMMLLALRDGQVLGHAGFTGYDAGVAEVQKVWLDKAARGAGIGGLLMAELQKAMVAAGYGGACLETAVFMQNAIRLYERHGYVRAVPFRDPPPGLAPVTVFMRARF
jgi:ribosomal protein S18 acetylase RimI-like enzyme